VPTSVIQESFGEIVQEVADFLDGDIYPILTNRIDKGTLAISPPDMATKAKFIAAWSDYDIVERALLVLQIFAAHPSMLKPEVGAEAFVRKIAAVSILLRIGDAAKSAAFDDHEGVARCSMDVERCKDFLQPPHGIFDAMDQAVKFAMSAKAALGGRTAHQSHNRAKSFVVAEWKIHRTAYNNNKSAFTRDYVKRIRNEYSVTVTEKQMREVWLKDALPTGKPAGLPVDGE
jgi:hypothetical protein